MHSSVNLQIIIKNRTTQIDKEGFHINKPSGRSATLVKRSSNEEIGTRQKKKRKKKKLSTSLGQPFVMCNFVDRMSDKENQPLIDRSFYWQLMKVSTNKQTNKAYTCQQDN